METLLASVIFLTIKSPESPVKRPKKVSEKLNGKKRREGLPPQSGPSIHSLWPAFSRPGEGFPHGRLVPYLILPDVMMPDGSGFDFCAELQQKQTNAPIIFLTCRDEMRAF